MAKKISTLKIVLISVLCLIVLFVAVAIGIVLNKVNNIIEKPDSTIFGTDSTEMPSDAVENYEHDFSGVYGEILSGESDAELVCYIVTSGSNYDLVAKNVAESFYLYKLVLEKNGEEIPADGKYRIHIFARGGINPDNFNAYSIGGDRKFYGTDSSFDEEFFEIIINSTGLGYFVVTDSKIESAEPYQGEHTVETPEPSETPDVTETPEPSETPDVTKTPEPSETPEITETPEPSETPDITETPDVAETPDITETPKPTPTPTPKPTPTPTPTPTPKPTPTPQPTPKPTPTPRPEYGSNGDKFTDNGFTVPNFEKSGVTNILIIGIDTRQKVFSGCRSDVMMILSINSKTKTVSLTSIMRDLRVQIAGKNYSTKINAAYAYGGPSCLMKTIENHFGIPIDNYVVVNFTGATDIINKLGGTEMDLTSNEAEALGFTSGSGKYKLNGQKTLDYMRLRHTDNDYYRTKRQGKVLSYLFNKYMSSSLSDILEIADDCTKYIKTDLSAAQMVSVLSKVYSYRENGLNHDTYPYFFSYGNPGRLSIAGSSDIKESSYPVQINKLYQKLYNYIPAWN